MGGNGTDPGLCTTRGGTGGNGGDWGQDGEDTSGNDAGKGADGGKAGAAICGEIPGYSIVVTGDINGNTVKGSYNKKCDGSGGTPPNGTPPNVTLSKSGNTLTWNITSTCSFAGCGPQLVTATSSPYDPSWDNVVGRTQHSGSVTVTATLATTYTLRCSNAYGTGQASVSSAGTPTT